MNVKIEPMKTNQLTHGLCGCGCGRKTNLAIQTSLKFGRVKGQPYKYIAGHNTRILGPEYIVDANGCWIWQRYYDKKGYGRPRIGGKNILAHRLYYEKFKGPIPAGLQLDHLCRVRACVNPDHLEAVTNAENCQRGSMAKLTMKQASEIRFLYKDGLKSHRALAWAYGIHHSNVGYIVREKTWTCQS